MNRFKIMASLFVLLPMGASAANSWTGSIAADTHKTPRTPELAKITMVEAFRAAQLLEPTATVTEIALETKNGFLVYEVELITKDKSKIEFLVDAGTGAVLHRKAKRLIKWGGHND